MCSHMLCRHSFLIDQILLGSVERKKFVLLKIIKHKNSTALAHSCAPVGPNSFLLHETHKEHYERRKIVKTRLNHNFDMEE